MTSSAETTNPIPESLPITVVLAAPELAGEIEAHPEFHEIREQALAAGGELIVAASRAGDGVTLRRWPDATDEIPCIPPPPGRLTPHLWQAGIAASRGRIVVLTLAGLVPKDQWLPAHLRAHASSEWAVVGGAIEPDPASARIDRAIALSRYSAVMPPFEPYEVGDVAADNASYTREAIDACGDSMRDGFWEPPVHARLRKLGKRLLLDSAPGMIHGHTNTFGSFIGQRLKHGFRYGRDRRREVGGMFLLKYFALCWALPVILTARVISRAKAKGMRTAEPLALLPELWCFNLAWTLGEAAGMIVGGRNPEARSQNPEARSQNPADLTSNPKSKI